MIVFDKLLVGGIKFVLDKVASAAESEMSNPETLKQELLAAQMELELGQISEEDFAEIEGRILSRLRELRGDDGGPIGVVGAGASVEVEMAEQSSGNEPEQSPAKRR